MGEVIIILKTDFLMNFYSFTKRFHYQKWTFVHKKVEINKKMNYNSFIKIKLLWGNYGKRW